MSVDTSSKELASLGVNASSHRPTSRKGVPRGQKFLDGREEEFRSLSPIMSLSQLAIHFSCSEICISRTRRRLGLKAGNIIQTTSKFFKFKDEFIEKHNKLSDKNLAEYFGVHVSTIEKWRVKLKIKKNTPKWSITPHPKGATGLILSKEIRDIITKKGKEKWDAKTEEEKFEITLKRMKTRESRGTMYPARMNATWKGGWRTIGNRKVFFRSSWEANFGRYLEWLKSNNQIIDWDHEPKTFWFNEEKITTEGKKLKGVKRGTVSYLPDFSVKEKNGEEVYYEVKGWMDDRSKTKLNRMKLYFPEIKLILIDSKSYKELSRKISSLVPEWEKS